MAAWAPEPVVQVEVAESSVEIVAPEQTYDPAAEPDAFRIAGRSIERMLRLGELVDLLRLFARLLAARGGLVGGFGFGALCESRDG